MVSKCRGIAVMEMAQEVGVTTRARAASAMGATTTTTNPATSAKRTRKRRKIIINNDQQRLEFSASSSIERRRSRADDVIQPEAEDELAVSCCSSNGSVQERIEFVDLEIESARGETSTCNSGDERREMSPSSDEFRLNSEDAEPTETNTTHRISVTQKMPSELELEEFFAAAEKDIQKRFAEKYNYDVVKDVPLEGRYQWVQIKP